MVERPISMSPFLGQIPETARGVVNALVPEKGSLIQKIARNSMSCDADGTSSGLFVTMSRVNHDCLGNCDHHYSSGRGVKILVASRTIRRGEEILFSYVCGKKSAKRKQCLQEHYGFTCTCCVRKNQSQDTDLDRMIDLDESILTFGSMGQTEQAIRKGNLLLALYEKYSRSSWSEHRTYYDLFQVAVTKRMTVKDAKRYMQKAYEAALRFTSDEEDESVRQMKGFVDFPESHRNYLLLG